MPLQPGEILDGKYRIIRMVGEGGMGAVYEGENTRIKRTVAIKVLHAAVAEKTDVVNRFEREAQAAGRIGSEHIVEVLDLGTLPSGERFMVMEFLSGEDLTGRIKRKKRLQPQETVKLLSQVLDGLSGAHDAGIIHRDLKPDNIFIIASKAGRADFVKILDFGVSKFSALDNEMSMTRTGAVMGTPYYMSPEQAKGNKIDARSDVYAMGVVAYQCITGRVPFNAGSFNELLFKIALESPEPIAQVVPDVPPSFAALVERAMQRDPEHRFQTAREFKDALVNWSMTAPTEGSRTEALPMMPDMMAPTPQPGMQPALQQSSPSNPGLGQSDPMAAGVSGAYRAQQQSIPGTNTPAGAMGLSQPALAITSSGPKKRGGMVMALVAVGIAIIGAGAVGAYLVVRSPGGDQAAAGETQESSAETGETAAETAETGGDAETASETSNGDGDGDGDTDVAASASASAEPETTAKPSAKPAVVPPPAPVPRPVPRPTPRPVPKPVAKPDPKPDPKPAPKPGGKGRRINTDL
jgi:serine/threonine-protein kinase